MRIEVDEVTIKLSGAELYEVATSIYFDLKSSIDRHYNHLQQNKDGEQTFNEMCGKKIKMMHDFYIHSGYSHMVTHSGHEFKQMFASRRKERAEKAKEN